MWLLNDPPRELLKEKYSFDLTDAWLERAMQASRPLQQRRLRRLRLARRADRHQPPHRRRRAAEAQHAGHGPATATASSPRRAADELKCPDLELNVLQAIEDVTDARERGGEAGDDAGRGVRRPPGRHGARSRRNRSTRPACVSDVVTLYQGGLYHLYRYKKYTDVRLVFAPEHGIAFFGGDVDNFEYPRFNLDVCFFRAYENGKPAQVASTSSSGATTGPAEGDLVFVTGHPGTTNRLETLAKLKHRRDVTLPYTLPRLRTLEAALDAVRRARPGAAPAGGDRPAPRRQRPQGVHRPVPGPARPADPRSRKRAEEASCTTHVGRRRARRRRSRATSRGQRSPTSRRSSRRSRRSTACSNAATPSTASCSPSPGTCVRLADELPKPTADRLREYRDSNLESLKFQLFSPAPIYPDLERAKLAGVADVPGRAPRRRAPARREGPRRQDPRPSRADELVAGTKLADPAERKKLVDGGKTAIDASTDPMIVLARSDRRRRPRAAQAVRGRGRGSRNGRPTPRSPKLRFAGARHDASPRTRRSRCGSRSAP